MALYCGPHACFDCGSRLVSLCKLVRYRGGARRLKRREFAALRGRVGLVSYPRSGNSLLRALLEACSGVLTGSDALPDAPLNIAAEVQLIYVPYLEQGRKQSHLPYKVMRCAAPSELARDAGGKRAVGKAQREAQRVCSEIAEAMLAARASC